MIRKLGLCLFLVLILLKIKCGHVKTKVPKVSILISETAVSSAESLCVLLFGGKLAISLFKVQTSVYINIYRFDCLRDFFSGRGFNKIKMAVCNIQQ